MVLPRAKVPRPAAGRPGSQGAGAEPAGAPVFLAGAGRGAVRAGRSYEQAQLLLQAATGVPAGNQQLEQIIIDPARDAPGYDPGQAGGARPARDGAGDLGGQRGGGDAAGGPPGRDSPQGPAGAPRRSPPGRAQADCPRPAWSVTSAAAGAADPGAGHGHGSRRAPPAAPEAASGGYTADITAIRAETISALPGRGRPPRPGPHLALDRAGGRRQPPGRGHPRAGRRAQGPAVP